MGKQPEFIDLLNERRKDCDILWASRSMDIQFPHKLPEESKYTREQVIGAVLNDKKVRQIIPVVASIQNVDERAVKKQVRAVVNEMASKARLVTVRWLSMVVTKAMKRIFSNIYINEDLLLRLKKEMQLYQVQYVYAPSHRSYLDFILVSYVLFSYDMALPNIASGMDFFQMAIVGELLRHAGAFFMRRSFANDLLYKAVFGAYISSIISHSDRAMEFFIEGTRSRSLKNIAPKYGLLSNILESLLEGKVPDICFVPISISYERPPEELLFVYELLGVPKPKESTVALFRTLSIFKKPFAYGRVYFNIAEPVSASQFLTTAQRKARVLSPDTKLNPSSVKALAYYLVDTHKKNTVLTPINIVALLFNERIQTQPGDPYTLDTLIEDYLWCKNVLSMLFDATISNETSSTKDNSEKDISRADILNTLNTHKELIFLDSTNVLRIIERHKEIKPQDRVKVKGHRLSKETMQLAVSSINICIYINPTLAFLTTSAMAVVAVGSNKLTSEKAFTRYQLLRTLLSTEFAMPFTVDKTVMKSEWDGILKLLLRENCLKFEDNSYMPGQNKKLHSLLYNVILPFIDATYITCLALFEWDEAGSNHPSNRDILVEAQKRAEAAFLENKSWGKHPYSLALDLYNTTLSNLQSQGLIIIDGQSSSYRTDKIGLAKLIRELEELELQRPAGSYLELNLLPPKPSPKL